MTAPSSQPGVVLRLVVGGRAADTSAAPSPALSAALDVARDALSAAMLRRGAGDDAAPAVGLLVRARRTVSRVDVAALAAALGALAVEGAAAVSQGAADTDTADEAARLARAAGVLLATLPRG